MKHIIQIFLVAGLGSFSLSAQPNPIQLTSPDQKLMARILTGPEARLEIRYQDKIVLAPSKLGLEIEGKPLLGTQNQKPKITQKQTNQVLKAQWGKRSIIEDNHSEMKLDFGSYALEIRCFNDAVAYRWSTRFPEKQVLVKREILELAWEQDPMVYFPAEKTDLQSSFESNYLHQKLTTLRPKSTGYLPLIVEAREGIHIAITESDLREYPGMHLRRPGQDTLLPKLEAVWAAYPSKIAKGGFQNFLLQVTERERYLARTEGTRTYPWRIFVVTDNDKNLADNDIVFKLASPPAPQSDFSWVQPGKAIWDWWADWTLSGVGFKSGINTDTYKAHIDFASENKIPYIILDEGWTDAQNLSAINPALDLDFLVAYGKQKGVRLVVWTLYHTLESQLEPFMAWCQAKGIAGLKVDFFDRDDQIILAAQEKMAQTAARFKLVLDFHGTGKPTGLSRTYPNVLNYEGVLGNEFNKWSDKVQPEHTVLLPFTRMLAGPMDFTPGGMRNTHYLKKFPIQYSQPYTMGTRCRQLAMYVVYDAGLQMLCDFPGAYRKEPGILDFLTAVPVSWDQTLVLQASIGKHLVVARKSGKDWYLGAINDNQSFNTNLQLNFLEAGKTYRAFLWKDGVNAERFAEDYAMETLLVRKGDPFPVSLCRAGGLAVRFVENP